MAACRVPPGVAAVLARRVAALANQRREPAGDARLTLREREILRLIDDGLSNKEIALPLSLQTKTVKNHVSNILAKLGGVHPRGRGGGPVWFGRPLRAGLVLRAQAHLGPT